MNKNTNSLSEEERIKVIRQVIRQRGSELRQAYPWLKHQNKIGMGIFIFAVLGVVTTGWAYWQGHLSAWLCIPIVAILTSLLHELEHDLIHWQYFRNNKLLHNVMLLVGWILRPGTINPWIRRKLHFLHHKTSGTSADLEERGIGNGLNYGWLRGLVMLDTLTGNIIKVLLMGPKGKKTRHVLRIIAANFPVAVVCVITWYGFLLFHLIEGIAQLSGYGVGWSDQTLLTMGVIDKWVVVLIAPFYLRSFCLNFISSNMHYYGGVSTLREQTQVLNAWFLWPFQLFCFNFGSTHGIHHFVVGEPFYIRQLTAPEAHRVMREHGVRFNDLGTFQRANRYQLEDNVSTVGVLQ